MLSLLVDLLCEVVGFEHATLPDYTIGMGLANVHCHCNCFHHFETYQEVVAPCDQCSGHLPPHLLCAVAGVENATLPRYTIGSGLANAHCHCNCFRSFEIYLEEVVVAPCD